MITITAKFSLELEFEIEGTYQPGEPAKMPNFSDDVGCPEEPEFIEVEKVVRVGIPTSKDNKWVTTWLKCNAYFMQALNELIDDNDTLREYAEDAIRQEALSYD